MIASVLFRDSYFGPCDAVIYPEQLKKQHKLVLFWGGADISPHFYGEANARSYCDPERDYLEFELYKKVAELEIPMLGICRGAQFLTAMAGGKLWQHVENHGRNHPVRTEDGQVFTVTSTHHQMMRPPTDGKLIAWSEEVLSPLKENEDGEQFVTEPEPEIVYYPKIKALAVQGHPEYLARTNPFPMYVAQLCKRYLNVDL